ncbi:unnamed protein product [Caenorhabditis sp. 36 PRJEB53466]|nr:unnamed protein product [Caenorhabditis sp. 36 PRJEB53466]
MASTANSIFPSLPLFPDLAKTLAPMFNNLIQNFPNIPLWGGIPNLQQTLPNGNEFLFQAPSQQKISRKRKKAPKTSKISRNSYIRRNVSEVTGPAFVVDYAPHLKESTVHRTQAKRRRLNDSPDVIYVETIKRQPLKPPTFVFKEIKQEPFDDFIRSEPNEIQNRLSFPTSIPVPHTPQPIMPRIMPPPWSALTKPQAAGHQPFIPPEFTPNQLAYINLVETIEKRKLNYLRIRAIELQCSCICQKRLLTDQARLGYHQVIEDVQRKFDRRKNEVMCMLSPEERADIVQIMLRNLTKHHQEFRFMSEEMLDHEFEYFLERNIRDDELKEVFKKPLISFTEFLSIIRNSILTMDLIDCSPQQKEQLINAVQFDWSKPDLYPDRLRMFSRIIGLSVERLLEILLEVRARLWKNTWFRELIFINDATLEERYEYLFPDKREL